MEAETRSIKVHKNKPKKISTTAYDIPEVKGEEENSIPNR
jgi:hypothetical protein